MAKDPAFLFYPGDYISGTMHLDFECKGAYVDLLMLQFQKDHMSIHMIKHVLGHKFDHIWPLISDKFKEVDGKYWNERLKLEKQNRINFCKSRKKNREGTKQVITHMSPHMEDEDIIVLRVLESNQLLNGEGENEKKVLAMVILEMEDVWKRYKPGYATLQETDYPALLEIAYYIAARKGWTKHSITDIRETEVINSWEKWVVFLTAEKTAKFFKKLTLDTIAKPAMMQKIEEAMRDNLDSQKGKMIL